LEREVLTKTQAAQINAVTLAFLGDAVFTLFVRERLVRSNTGKAADLQRASAQVVSAKGQSVFLEKVLALFTDEENEVFHRGRNAKKATKSKNASAGEYARSTGFEAVLGYLYLIGEDERIQHLLSFVDEEKLKGQAAAISYKP
jgi:ribonuclease-3 family protein